ncbi:MAG: amino acid-binding protein [Bacteroidaceae bacterium]|nr:amino acid-binding protein [Bacteroidaceae bacterium]MDO5482831.1 amino acid-binding protein [Bacteroidaceae bacterium]
MTIKQLSIFIENKSGTLINVLDLLSKAGIQIIASTIADTKDYGIYRILCDNPAQAYIILKESGINVQLSDVIALSIDDAPGRAAAAIKQISDAGVSILYLYSFLWKSKGVLVFRTDQSEKAKETIMLNKMNFLTEEDFR